MVFLIGFIEDDLGDSFEFGTDTQHTFNATLFFGYAEEGEEVDYLIHEFDIRASTSILGVL